MEVRGGRTGAEPSSPPAKAMEAAARQGSRERRRGREAREAGAALRVGPIEDPLGDARQRGRGRGGAAARWPPPRLAPCRRGGGAEVGADGRARRRSHSSLPASACGGTMAPRSSGGGMALGPAVARGGRELGPVPVLTSPISLKQVDGYVKTRSLVVGANFC